MGYSPWSHKESDTTEQLTQYTKMGYNVRVVSLSFIGDKMRPAAQETAPQIALKTAAKRQWGKVNI